MPSMYLCKSAVLGSLGIPESTIPAIHVVEKPFHRESILSDLRLAVDIKRVALLEHWEDVLASV